MIQNFQDVFTEQPGVEGLADEDVDRLKRVEHVLENFQILSNLGNSVVDKRSMKFNNCSDNDVLHFMVQFACQAK